MNIRILFMLLRIVIILLLLGKFHLLILYLLLNIFFLYLIQVFLICKVYRFSHYICWFFIWSSKSFQASIVVFMAWCALNACSLSYCVTSNTVKHKVFFCISFCSFFTLRSFITFLRIISVSLNLNFL